MVSRIAPFVAALTLALASGVAARADFTFDTNNIPSAKNVNLDNATNATTIFGQTQQDINGHNIGFTFNGADHLLDASHGDTISASGTNQHFTTLTATVESGYGVTDVDFKLQPDSAVVGTDYVTITAYDQFGNFTVSAPLYFSTASGENDFAVHAINGEILTKLTWTSTAPINSQKQFSVLGVRAVPEPGSIALLGLGGLGAASATAMRRRRARVS